MKVRESPPKRDQIHLSIGDALEVLDGYIRQGITYDAIITDPPYELSMYSIGWDKTGVSFSPKLWHSFFSLLKPGAFLVAFSHPRLYHRLGVAAEDAGFTIYPFLTWNYGNSGMPQPQNVSTLFDRANVKERKIIGYKRRSGYATGLVRHGVQNYNSMMVPVYEKYVSPEAQDWKGYYYGLKTFKPNFEPILLVQKPVLRKRMIENIREFGTGPLYMGTGLWPTPELHHPKARKSEHGCDHPTVKPISLMMQLIRIACPMIGERRILDPFAGSGTTGVAALRLGIGCDLIERDASLESVIRRRVAISP